MSRNAPDVRYRRSIRLPGYDYRSPGAYFVTICVRAGECLLGEVVDGEMWRNAWGQIVLDEWLASKVLRRELHLDTFVVMPNHIHGIVWISAADLAGAHADAAVLGAHGRAPLPERAPRSLGSFVAGYKAAATRRINLLRGTPGLPFWQRNYWEHVIRSEASLQRIRDYILSNPARWAEDRLHPDVTPNLHRPAQPSGLGE